MAPRSRPSNTGYYAQRILSRADHRVYGHHRFWLKNEVVDGQYTGELIGTPTFQAGKVKALAEWRASRTENFDQVWFYSDSHNDLPLLENADVPVAVDADERLTAIAQDREWKIMSFRD